MSKHFREMDPEAGFPCIEARGVRQSFGGVEAVAGVDLTVRRGEVYALMGTNGAGKSTLLEILEGHRSPGSGSVRVEGRDPRDRLRVRPHVGIMLQESGLALDLRASEYLHLLGAISGRQDSAARLLEAVGLQRQARTLVGALSGGERRRLDFAAAIWGSPRLLFLDEPTAGLDPAVRGEFWRYVEALRPEGTTVLLTTHHLEDAQRHADRIAVMHRGSIRREGTLSEIVSFEPSTISFTPPVAVEELPLQIAGTRGPQVLIQTDAVQRDLGTLLDWATRAQVQIDDLTTSTSSLEEAFRSLTEGP